MTYEEFRDEVEALGLCIKEKGSLIRITTKGDYYVADVNKEKEFEICTESLATLGDSKEKILDLCYQLAKTPIKERESKKYYLIHKLIRKRNFNNAYLHLDLNDGSFLTGSECVYINVFEEACTKVQFTLDEIEGIKEEYGVTLENWELVEVEE